MSRRKPIKTKKCPRCNTPHSKRGTYCSYSCANVREQTEEIKKRKSEIQYSNRNGKIDIGLMNN